MRAKNKQGQWFELHGYQTSASSLQASVQEQELLERLERHL